MACPGRKSGRFGFTLTEILVVLVIIAVLIGLTTLMVTWTVQVTDDLTDHAHAAQLPHLKRQAPAARAQTLAAVSNRHIVVLQPTANLHATIAQIRKTIPLEVTHLYTQGITGFAAVIPPAAVAAVQKAPGVSYLEPDQVASIQAQTLATGMRRIDCPLNSVLFGAHDLPLQPRNIGIAVPRKDSTQIVVAIMDTGIDKTHPDLNVTFSKSFGKFDDLDAFGHGTHVAGIVGAKNNDIGVVGVCPGCKLWNLKVLDASGSGTAADMLTALDFVIANASKIRVVNMSLRFAAVVKSINAQVTACWDQGVVMVSAAGNDSVDARTASPASAVGTITVGALADSDGKPGGLGPKLAFNGDPDDTMASFSNFGPRIDFLAPGVDILSTYPVSLGSYKKESGTSMAAPHVAGLCALMMCPAAILDGPIRNLEPLKSPVLPLNFLSPPTVKRLLLQSSPDTPLSARANRITGKLDKLVHPVINSKVF
jgi:subtilisin